MKVFIDKIKKKQNLTLDESKSAFEFLMSGKASDDEIYQFLTLLSSGFTTIITSKPNLFAKSKSL